MSQYTLRMADDVVTAYRMYVQDQCVGEIRQEQLHTQSLHLGDQRYWLIHQEASRGANLLQQFLGKLRLDRTHVLHDGQAELARARRHWTWLGKRDWVEFHCAGDARAIAVEAKGLLVGDIRLRRDGVQIGTMAFTGFLRDAITLDAPGLTTPQAALLMLAVQSAWGGNPYVRHQVP